MLLMRRIKKYWNVMPTNGDSMKNDACTIAKNAELVKILYSMLCG